MRNRLLFCDAEPIRKPTHLLLQYCLFLLLSLAVLAMPRAVLGQTDVLATEEWAATAERAISRLADPQASSTDLEALRAKLSEERGAALLAQDGLKLRVETLESELATLGPAPEEGTSEAPEIAENRAELNQMIGAAKVPLLRAQAAYQRADGLIDEIDDVLRARLSAELTSLGPSPLNPVLWPKALSQVGGVGERVVAGYEDTLENGFRRAQFVSRVPFAVLLLILGLIVQFYAKPRAVTALWAKYHAASKGNARHLWRLALGLAQNILPVIAAIAVIVGVVQLDPRQGASEGLIGTMVSMAAAIVFAYWIGNALFSPDDLDLAIVRMAPKSARRARRNGLFVAIILALMIFVEYVVREAALSDATRAIVLFPLFLLGCLFLARLSIILRSRPEPVTDAKIPVLEEEATSKPTSQVIRDALSRAGVLVSCIVPVLAAVGYLSAANFLFAPTAFTFALIGALVAIYVRFRDGVDIWLDGAGDASSRSYRKRFRSIPVIAGFFLTCIAVPLLALIWGARVSELQEVWIWLRDGVTIGDVRLSVTDVLAFILVFAIGYTITRMLQAVMRGSVLPRVELDRGATNAIVSGIGYVGIFLSAVIAISATGLSLGNLAIVAGALSVGIGFGLQTIVSNFVSGIILLVERPIKEGDWIEVAGFSGYVKKISVRSTMIDTFDRASVIVPNSELIAGTVLNWTHSEMSGRVIVPVGVAYGEDPRKVEEILRDIAETHPMVLRKPAPAVVFMGFGADSMDFEIRAFLRDVNWMLSAKSQMNFAIVEKFTEAGIEIPYAQRDINLRNVDEAAKAFWQGKRESDRNGDA